MERIMGITVAVGFWYNHTPELNAAGGVFFVWHCYLPMYVTCRLPGGENPQARNLHFWEHF